MKEDLRVKKTCNALKKSLVSLLKKKSFDSITVSEICDTAHINRVTFYSHYKDKYDLFVAFIDDLKNEVIYLTNVAMNEKGLHSIHSRETIIAYCQLLFEKTIFEAMTYRDVLIHFSDQDNSLAFYIIEKTALDMVTNFFKRVEIQENKKMKYSPDVLAAFIVGGVSKIITLWSLNPKMVSKNEVLDNANRFIIGLANSDLFE